jgi:hypothetical protein
MVSGIVMFKNSAINIIGMADIIVGRGLTL